MSLLINKKVSLSGFIPVALKSKIPLEITTSEKLGTIQWLVRGDKSLAYKVNLNKKLLLMYQSTLNNEGRIWLTISEISEHYDGKHLLYIGPPFTDISTYYKFEL